MFVGHGLVVFAIAAYLASRAGWSRERALAVGLVAGAFGLAPDVDILYAPLGMVGASTALGAAEAFWSTGNVVHRAVTHSLVVGAAAALAAGLWTWRTRPSRTAAVLTGAALVAVAWPDGALAAAVMAVFAVAVLGVASVGRHLGLDARTVGAAALLGLLSHPFGDLFTGEPPAMLYPLDATLVTEHVVLHPDPTLHLLGALGVELATAWLAVLVYLRLHGHPLGGHVTPRAAFGAAYAPVAFVLPPPTLEASYHFVFPLLGLGVACAVGCSPATWRQLAPRRGRADEGTGAWFPVAVTGLAAVTLAACVYALLYVAV